MEAADSLRAALPNTASSPGTKTAVSHKCLAYYPLSSIKTPLQMKNITSIDKILFLTLFSIVSMMGQNPAFVYFTGYSLLEKSPENLKDALIVVTEQGAMGKGSITKTQSKFQNH